MSEFLSGWKRTHYCAEPTAQNVGEEMLLMGWAATWRNLGSLIFIGLRDRTGIMQVVFNENKIDKNVFELAEAIRTEYVIAVKGKLVNRVPEMVNPNMATGAFELIATDLKILAKAQTPPIYIDDDLDCQEQIRLKYRYLDLRRPCMQKIMRLRHEITQCARNYFNENGFMEIETPMLCRSTPEGARDYLVPSRVHPGEFYALPQSPQLFKQLLMMSGMDRYFQIARCFRDEDLRADRQPEFTQIDLEMSFVDEDDVMRMNEGFIQRLLKEIVSVDVQLPLKRIPYSEAMERFGSDKPDTRFELELKNVSDIVADCGFGVFTGAIANGGSVRCINAKGAASKFTRKQIDELTEFVKIYKAKGLAWMSMKPEGMQCSFAKFLTPEQIQLIHSRTNVKEGDIVFFFDRTENVRERHIQLRQSQTLRVQLDLPVVYCLRKLRTAADKAGQKAAVAFSVAVAGILLKREIKAVLTERAFIRLVIGPHREYKGVVEIDHRKLSFFQSGCRHRLPPSQAPRRT